MSFGLSRQMLHGVSMRVLRIAARAVSSMVKGWRQSEAGERGILDGFSVMGPPRKKVFGNTNYAFKKLKSSYL
jgi:hypothetical protein